MAEAEKRESLKPVSFLTYFLQWVGFLVFFYGQLNPDGHYVAIGIMLYLVHIIESSFYAKTAQYLENTMSEKEFEGHVEQMQEANPDINFNIECYHIETRSSGNGNTNEVQKVTHTADMQYPVGGFVDETLSPAQTMAMFHLLHDGTKDLNDVEAGESAKKDKRRILLLCHFIIDFQPASEGCEHEFNDRRESFYQANTTNAFQNKMETCTCQGFKERIMVVTCIHNYMYTLHHVHVLYIYIYIYIYMYMYTYDITTIKLYYALHITCYIEVRGLNARR